MPVEQIVSRRERCAGSGAAVISVYRKFHTAPTGTTNVSVRIYATDGLVPGPGPQAPSTLIPSPPLDHDALHNPAMSHSHFSGRAIHSVSNVTLRPLVRITLSPANRLVAYGALYFTPHHPHLSLPPSPPHRRHPFTRRADCTAVACNGYTNRSYLRAHITPSQTASPTAWTRGFGVNAPCSVYVCPWLHSARGQNPPPVPTLSGPCFVKALSRCTSNSRAESSTQGSTF
jgi:hypothetical protein